MHTITLEIWYCSYIIEYQGANIECAFLILQYKDTSRHSDAIDAYERAIVLDPGHTSAWNNIALLYEDLSKL